MIVVSMLIHALLGVAPIGAIALQAMSVWRFKPTPAHSFVGRFSANPAVG